MDGRVSPVHHVLGMRRVESAGHVRSPNPRWPSGPAAAGRGSLNAYVQDSGVAGLAAGEQARPTRPAHGRDRECVAEPDPVRHQQALHRRHGSERVPALVVGDDEDDVGPRRTPAVDPVASGLAGLDGVRPADPFGCAQRHRHRSARRPAARAGSTPPPGPDCEPQRQAGCCARAQARASVRAGAAAHDPSPPVPAAAVQGDRRDRSVRVGEGEGESVRGHRRDGIDRGIDPRLQPGHGARVRPGSRRPHQEAVDVDTRTWGGARPRDSEQQNREDGGQTAPPRAAARHVKRRPRLTVVLRLHALRGWVTRLDRPR